MASRLAIGAVAGAAVGGALTFVVVRRHQARSSVGPGSTPSPLPGHASHPCLKHGLPMSDGIRMYTNFIASIDTRLRNPKWVIEHLTRSKLKGDGTRSSSQFTEDAGVGARFRAKLSDYRGTGYDRGHMAPASNHKESQGSMDETFSLSNIAPQVGGGFNRDYWARFERFVQDTTKSFDDVWVVTGPLYIPRPGPSGWVLEHPMLGQPPQMVAVPTHFFKVVLAEQGDASTAVAAFVMPNSAIPAEYPLSAFSVPLTSLEEVSGLTFFPSLLDDARRMGLDAAALRWQALGRADAQRARLAPGASPPALLPPPPSLPGNAVVKSAVGAAVTAVFQGSNPAHLCDKLQCRLPAEDFWKGPGGGASRDRKLQRSQSAKF
ncbi:hypothetical protein ACKKBG_A10765 [Auxenochlorella protothecoides x Auxenochlorella symbiontica]